MEMYEGGGRYTRKAGGLLIYIFTPSHLQIYIFTHTLTSADLDLHTLTSADLHLHTLRPADLHLHILTSADLHLHTFTSAHLLSLFFLSLPQGGGGAAGAPRNATLSHEMDVGCQKLR